MIITEQREAVYHDFISYCQQHKGKILKTSDRSIPFGFDILEKGFEYKPSKASTPDGRIHSFNFIKDKIFSEDFPDNFHENTYLKVLVNKYIDSNPLLLSDDLPISTRSKRVIEGKEIYISSKEEELTKRFLSWLKSTNNQYKFVELEQKANDRDRIDVVLTQGEREIYAELKSVSSYSSKPKRAIRAALGQVLDYQYYDGKPRAHELWIVLDKCELNSSESDFIRTLNNNFKNMNLRLVIENSKGNFKVSE